MEINTQKDTKTATLCAIVQEAGEERTLLRFGGYDTPQDLRKFLNTFKGVTVISIYHIDADGRICITPPFPPALPKVQIPDVISSEDKHKHKVWDDIVIGEC